MIYYQQTNNQLVNLLENNNNHTNVFKIYYQQGLWWSGKYSLILNQEVLGSIPLGYGVAFVRKRFSPQCGTSRREFRFSWAPMCTESPC